MYRDFTGLHLHLSDSLAEARSQIAELELDVLVYLDIGINFSLWLFSGLCEVGASTVCFGRASRHYRNR